MKAKAAKITAQSLIVEIQRHVLAFRLLNPYILNGCSEFLIIHSSNIDAGYIRDILHPFGVLHYQPLNSSQFWQCIETYLMANFVKIPPMHIVDIMLSAVYLEMFPVNFVEQIFNRYFIHLLHSTVPMEWLPVMRNNLKLLDTALTLECSEYRGPLLPRDHINNPIYVDNRIKRLLNDSDDIITMIAGDKSAFTKLTIPQQLPHTGLYMIDILFHPVGLGRLWNFNAYKDRDVYVAALIHLPEHYDSSRKYLTGPQKMRIRHLRRIGLKVVSLKYEQLTKLGMHRQELHEYFVEQMKQALPALVSERGDSNTL